MYYQKFIDETLVMMLTFRCHLVIDRCQEALCLNVSFYFTYMHLLTGNKVQSLVTRFTQTKFHVLHKQAVYSEPY